MEKTNLDDVQYEQAIAEYGIEQELHQQSPGSFQADLSTRQLDGVVLYCDHFSQSYITHIPPPPQSIGIIAATNPANEALTTDGQAMGSDSLFLAPPGQGADMVVPAETSADSLTFPEQRFYEIAAAVSPGLQSLKQPGLVKGDASQLAGLRNMTRRLVQAPFSAPDHVHFDNLIAEWVAWLSQPDTRFERRHSVARARQAQIARRARAYLVEQYAQEIRMEEVCRELGVGLRNLQRCFAKYFQMSPYHYLKLLRFNKARRALLACTPGSVSVTHIAMDHGFQHVGRFAVEYRSMFGEQPRETLAGKAPAMAA